MGLKETKLFEVNNMIFVIVFFLFRIILGSYFLAVTWMHPRPSFLIKLGGTGIYIVGWFFMYDIARYITRFFRAKKKSVQSKASISSQGDIEVNGGPKKSATGPATKRNGLATTESYVRYEKDSLAHREHKL